VSSVAHSFVILAVIAMLAFVLGGCASGPAPETPLGETLGESPEAAAPPRAGTLEPGPAPTFSLDTLDGETISLADLEGRPVVLNFWSSSCPHCATLAPHLETLSKEHQEQGLQVLGVAGRDSEQALRDKAEALNLTYPIGMSPEAVSAYGVRGIPMTFFIDREGNIVSSILGSRGLPDVEAEVQKIL
jgi:cytochrome c biogenesis protein CcmG/thiol:disulfide interchange protein DsbE